jgi:hypothetical protein
MDTVKNLAFERIWRTLTTFSPQDQHEQAWLSIVYDRLNKLGDARNKRMVAVERHVPNTMWALMYFCGFVMIFFSCLFGSESEGLHITMVVALSSVIGLMLYVIADIDNSFSGLVRVEPEAFRHALETLSRL